MSVRQPLHFEPGRHNFPFCTMDTFSKYSEYLQCLLRCTTCVRVYFGRNHKNHKKSANADPEYFLPTKGQYVASNSTGPDNPFAFHLRRNVRPIRHATAKLQHDTIFLVDPCIVTMTSIMRRCPRSCVDARCRLPRTQCQVVHLRASFICSPMSAAGSWIPGSMGSRSREPFLPRRVPSTAAVVESGV